MVKVLRNLANSLILVFDAIDLVVDDVNRGFFGRGGAATDTDILGDQFCLGVFARSLVGRHKPARSDSTELASPGKFGYAF